MLSKNYLQICKLASYFLNKKKYWYAKYIQYFHPIKYHPGKVENYLNIFENKNLKEDIILRIIKYFNSSFYELFKIQNFASKKKNDVLIISNIISIKKKYGTKDDLYFGGFSERIKKCFILYRNYTNINSKEIESRLKEKNAIVANKKCFFIEEFFFILFSIYIYFTIKKDLYFEKQKKNKSFLKEASKYSHIGSSITNLRIYHQVFRIIKKQKVKKIFLTIEGHAWERLLIYKIKKKFKNIKIYGYQFTSLNKYNAILNMRLNKVYYPNKILTVGKLNYNLLNRSTIRKKIPIKIIGTSKYQITNSNKKFSKKCLIIPSADKFELNKFYELTYELANSNKDFEFTFRLHPQINIKHSFKNKNKLPKNVKISKNDFNKDVKKNYFAIYGGSASIVNCLANGLWPIYYNYSDINIDVIHSLNLKHRSINNISNFKTLVKNKIYFKNNFVKIKKFYNDYYQPLNLYF